VCRSKHVEPLKNFGIITSITKLHLVYISTECEISYPEKKAYFIDPSLSLGTKRKYHEGIELLGRTGIVSVSF